MNKGVPYETSFGKTFYIYNRRYVPIGDACDLLNMTESPVKTKAGSDHIRVVEKGTFYNQRNQSLTVFITCERLSLLALQYIHNEVHAKEVSELLENCIASRKEKKASPPKAIELVVESDFQRLERKLYKQQTDFCNHITNIIRGTALEEYKQSREFEDDKKRAVQEVVAELKPIIEERLVKKARNNVNARDLSILNGILPE